MAGILLVVDGMTDEGFALADMPNLYRLAKDHAHGLLMTTPPGGQPETTACILNLLGLHCKTAGRGWLEALGAQVPFGQQDLLCKASWVTLDAAGVITGLCKQPPAFCYPGYHYLHRWQALVVVPGAAKATNCLHTVPPHQNIGKPYKGTLPKGCKTLAELCKAARGAGVALVPWGAAAPGALPGMAGTVVTATNGVRGIAKACGMALPVVHGATGDVDTNIPGKIDAALRAAETQPFVLLHVNGADEAAHRRDARAKHTFLQQVDGALPQLGNSGHRLLVCADHGASPAAGSHIGGAQPFVLVNGAQKGDLGTLAGGAAIQLLGGGPAWQRH